MGSFTYKNTHGGWGKLWGQQRNSGIMKMRQDGIGNELAFRVQATIIEKKRGENEVCPEDTTCLSPGSFAEWTGLSIKTHFLISNSLWRLKKKDSHILPQVYGEVKITSHKMWHLQLQNLRNRSTTKGIKEK